MKKIYIVGDCVIIHGIGDVRTEYKSGMGIELTDEEAARFGNSVKLKVIVSTDESKKAGWKKKGK